MRQKTKTPEELKMRKKLYMIKWEEENKERRKRYWKEHYAKPEVKERKRLNMKGWRATHKEHEKEYRRTKGRINNKIYQMTPKGHLNMILSVQRRLARRRNIIHKFTKEEWEIKLNKTKGICPNCEELVGIKKLELDHIYPISIADEDFKITGIKRVYRINDIQPLCKVCNREKSDKINSERKYL